MTKSHAEMIRIFKEESAYGTPNPKKGFFAFLGRTKPLFYSRFVSIILKGAKIARKGKYSNEVWIDNSLDTIDILEKAGARFDISGLDNLREEPDKGYVIIANHMSTLETVALPAMVQTNRNVTFIVKDSLVKGNIFGAIMRARDPIVVGRKNPREDLEHVLSSGEEILKSGTSLIIFPQSTRDNRFDPKKFNSLGVKLAKRAKTKVIPLALKTDCWGNGKWIKEYGRIDVSKTIYFHFDKPIDIVGNGKEAHQSIVEFIAKKQAAWAAS